MEKNRSIFAPIFFVVLNWIFWTENLILTQCVQKRTLSKGLPLSMMQRFQAHEKWPFSELPVSINSTYCRLESKFPAFFPFFEESTDFVTKFFGLVFDNFGIVDLNCISSIFVDLNPLLSFVELNWTWLTCCRS